MNKTPLHPIYCKPGQVFEYGEARKKKLELELVVKDSGWDVLWLCPTCGKFWEATSEGRYEEHEYLTCLEDEEVLLRWPEEYKKYRGKQK